MMNLVGHCCRFLIKKKCLFCIMLVRHFLFLCWFTVKTSHLGYSFISCALSTAADKSLWLFYHAAYHLLCHDVVTAHAAKKEDESCLSVQVTSADMQGFFKKNLPQKEVYLSLLAIKVAKVDGCHSCLKQFAVCVIVRKVRNLTWGKFWEASHWQHQQDMS